MKVFFETEGDESVGIYGGKATLEFNFEPKGEPEREDIRTLIKEFALNLFDAENARVLFWDECQDCGNKLSHQMLCVEPICIQNCEQAKKARRRSVK